ncbi:MAG TPA: alpha/beta hydrolase-fold protein, partial [Mycobacteriales bacterium]|nr:alpha/beta hydrolase-fold protein [Mycobacteriales bacterium]
MPRHMQRPRGWRMLAISAALGGSVAVAACSLAVATGLGVGGSVGGSMGGVVSGSVSTGTADVPTGGGPPAAAADQLIEAASAADAVLFAPVRKGVEHPRAASATAAAPAPPAPPAPAPPPAPPLVVRRTAVAAALPGGSLEQLSFPDPADRSRSERVLVWHPPGPDSSKLPVVYWLHGVPGRPEDFLGSGYLAAVAREVLAGQLAPVVIAMPDGNSARHADTEWADSASGDQDLATLVAGQVVGAVEQGHPRPSSLRTLAGFSMGGYGAADIALHHPQVFGSVVCLEGYF